MRAKRSKQYRKLMRQYEHLGFRKPYQVLIDAQLIRDAAKSKLQLGKLLEDALGGAEIKPMITQCCIRHLYNSPAETDAEKREKDGWIEVAKAAERRRCGHHELEEPLSALECLLSVVDPKGSGTNRHRYVVASQEQEVRVKMRGIVGVPLVYLKRSVMILEPMAGVTEQARDKEEREKMRAGLKGRRSAQAGDKRKAEEDGEGDAAAAVTQEAVSGDQSTPAPKKRKIGGPKGPNPLSMKKPKKEKENEKKTVAREVEDERSTIRKAEKTDPQASEKAVAAERVVQGAGPSDDKAEGSRKRRRKRKHTEAEGGGENVPNIAA
ncbi:uncharacterized protein LTR77_003952 [Saxophila tyrrhenica]|uniref:U three protein 23 n=1 Tax=Saxophila tyrrhenica TaxID=1690608 RepID=A0AAV9PJE0_9PEZI|nr:hypothetical protein LTR77_003952 [Saxophila tyrrhenica]